MDENNVPARPEFPMTPGGQVLGMAYDAHVAYQAAFDAAFGTTSLKRKEWEATLVAGDLDDETTIDAITEDASYSEDAGQVLAILKFAEQLVKDAKENLAGLYYGTKKAVGVDTTDIVSLRASVDNYLTVALGMVDVGLLTASEIWAVIPSTNRKVRNGGGVLRKVYGGDSLPQSRAVSPLRANSSWLRLEIQDEHTPELWHTVQAETFKSAVLVGLHLTMSDLRNIVGDFVEASYGTEYTHNSAFGSFVFRITRVKDK